MKGFEYGAMVLCFIGVLGIVMSKQSEKDGSVVGVLVALTMSWLYATCSVVNRRLKQVHFAVIGLWMGVAGVLLAFVYLIG